MLNRLFAPVIFSFQRQGEAERVLFWIKREETGFQRKKYLPSFVAIREAVEWKGIKRDMLAAPTAAMLTSAFSSWPTSALAFQESSFLWRLGDK